MKSMFFVLMLVLVGCGTQQRFAPNDSVPYPIEMALFPVLSDPPEDDVVLTVLFYIGHEGQVLDVALAQPGVSPTWDAAAIDSMKTWRFTNPPRYDDSDGVWVRRSVKVQFEEPYVLDLVTLKMDTQEIADSVFSTLRYRSRFIDLFEDSSNHNFNYAYSLERGVNVGRYPDYVRTELRKLRINSYTRPIQIDHNFVIIQRVDTLANHIQ